MPLMENLAELKNLDLSYPLLILILSIWAFLALAGILTTLAAKTGVGNAIKKVMARFRDFLDKRHSHEH